jgi:bis(5'-nucleosyl)-tetraphosphatase (symmetrical)
MAIYAIGDIQGQFSPLLQLLDLIKFNPSSDQLWLTGDLVNRGPDSLETLRFVKSLGNSVKTVLGNHDLHLLAVAAGVRKVRKQDTLAEILAAPDRDELLSWLRRRPFIQEDKRIKTVMVHAGIYMEWSRKKTIRHTQELEEILQGNSYLDFLKNMRGTEPITWKKSLSKRQRCRFIADACTRMRFCSKKGDLSLQYKGFPGSQPDALTPWFMHPRKGYKNWRIIFGHWSTLGYYRKPKLICLDSGCLWGRQLTAVRLDTKKDRIWQINCRS